MIQGREFKSQRGIFAALAAAPEVLLIKIPDSTRLCESASHGGDGTDIAWVRIFACLAPADVVGEQQVLADGGMHFPCTQKGVWGGFDSRLPAIPADAGLVTIERRTTAAACLAEDWRPPFKPDGLVLSDSTPASGGPSR